MPLVAFTLVRVLGVERGYPLAPLLAFTPLVVPIALVVADTAGTFPRLDDVTADFVYVRLHGDTELYTSGYSPDALDGWAALVRAWRAGESPVGEHTVAPPAARIPRDVYVYFDNDARACAPFDAIGLAERVD